MKYKIFIANFLFYFFHEHVHDLHLSFFQDAGCIHATMEWTPLCSWQWQQHYCCPNFHCHLWDGAAFSISRHTIAILFPTSNI